MNTCCITNALGAAAVPEFDFYVDPLFVGPLIEDTYHADPHDYYASMKRLLDYPVRLVHGGHFPSYGGDRHREIIQAWLDEKDR